MLGPLLVVIVAIALLAAAYTVLRRSPAVRQLALVFGWVGTIIGGLLLILALLRVTT